MEKALFGAGCFWGVEETFRKLKGVTKTEVGYSGGNTLNPTYETVCNGDTNHAEVVLIEYDEKELTFENLLNHFWKNHDPTTLNRQGPDIGTQYRSVIFYSTEPQLKEIENKLLKIRNKVKSEIVTEVNSQMNFFQAEDYHVNYYNLHKNQPYCNLVISPKITSFKKKFKNYIKD